MAKRLFITGSNGFLGRNMFESMLKGSNDKFYLLIRSEASKKSVIERVKRTAYERINFLDGDMTLPFLGLNENDLKKVLNCNEYWHFAAATSFEISERDSVMSINIGGAENMLQLAESNPDLRHLYFISTAYIAGNHNGIIYEDKMPYPVQFKNSYEESKYKAELIIRKSGLPWMIFRPSIIVGNSKTYCCQGKTRISYGYVLGIYKALLAYFKTGGNFIKSWKNESYPDVNIRMKGYYETKRNFVCIDDVVGMLNDIRKSNCTGKTYHLTSNHIIGRDISYAINSGFRVKGINYVGDKLVRPNKIELLAKRITAVFDDYCIYDDPDWDTTNTDIALTSHKKVGMSRELFSKLIDFFIRSEIADKYLRHASLHR